MKIDITAKSVPKLAPLHESTLNLSADNSAPAVTDEESVKVIDTEMLANLISKRVADEDICQILGIEPTDLAEYKETKVVTEAVSDAATAAVQVTDAIDDGWNAIERQSLETLKEIVQFDSDKEFVLRVAAHANKAQRRGNPTIGAVAPAANQDGQLVGGSAVISINLNTTTIEQLNNRDYIAERLKLEKVSEKNKELQTLSASGVEDILVATNGGRFEGMSIEQTQENYAAGLLAKEGIAIARENKPKQTMSDSRRQLLTETSLTYTEEVE